MARQFNADLVSWGPFRAGRHLAGGEGPMLAGWQ